jgi:hypothetical protein
LLGLQRNKLGVGCEEAEAYVGTAGEMFDFSLAGGLAPIESSFPRTVFSDATILLVAIDDCQPPDRVKAPPVYPCGR